MAAPIDIDSNVPWGLTRPIQPTQNRRLISGRAVETVKHSELSQKDESTFSRRTKHGIARASWSLWKSQRKRTVHWEMPTSHGRSSIYLEISAWRRPCDKTQPMPCKKEPNSWELRCTMPRWQQIEWCGTLTWRKAYSRNPRLEGILPSKICRKATWNTVIGVCSATAKWRLFWTGYRCVLWSIVYQSSYWCSCT